MLNLAMSEVWAPMVGCKGVIIEDSKIEVGSYYGGLCGKIV